MSPTRDELRARITEEEGRLTALDQLRDEARARLEMLRQEFTAAAVPPAVATYPPIAAPRAAPVTTVEKVRLFRSFFRGRADIFPTRFVSSRTGKSGYAPACANKFVPGVCELPRIRCAECLNQAFLPVDDQTVLDHLRGRLVMGVYPLLEDETCYLLAADFDKASWKDDVTAFAETCHSMAVPVAVERSRSGNGAHAWFFFSQPVPARVARQMGCYLITETMARRHELSMESYDRLFPNQDTMPRGGFGNLIALPLQHAARAQGHTIFLNKALEPYADQWAFLSSVRRLEPAAVEAIAREATRMGRVVGVQLAGSFDEGDATPWMRLPSQRTRRESISGPLPSEVRAVLTHRVFVEKTGLPSSLLNAIKGLAAFQNPEFYKKQGMRLSTATTPRVIACAEELARHVVLPRGCRADLEELLREHGVALIVDDQRYEGEAVSFQFHGELTDLQEQAIRALLQHDIGMFVAPPGIGKTVLGTYLVAARGRSALVLVHRRPLLDQWVAQLSMFLGIGEKEIGQVGSGKRKPNGRLDVAMIQSLVRKASVDDVVTNYGQVIVDECHHVPAVSFERVLSEVKARYIVGLTATPNRRDGHHPISEMQLGPVRFIVDAKNQAARRPFEHRLIVRETDFRLDGAAPARSIQEIYRALATDTARNQMILEDVIRAIDQGRSPVVLTERRDHLEYFGEQLRSFVRHLVVLQGGMTPKKRRELVARLAEVPDDQERLILATGRYIGEGFDDPRLDTLFLTMPVSWKGTLVQYAGRLHRHHARKTEVRIFDYVDRAVPMLARMCEKRLRAYRAIGYARGQTPLGYAEPVEMTVEYDEETMRYLRENV